MITKKQINLLVDTIAKKFNTTKIFLFGSYAYGKPALESDLDICVITDLGNKRKIELMRDIRREINLYFQISVDILLYDSNEFNKRSIHPATLEYKIIKQGILLNG
jgi:uncharacterized protein